MSRVLCDAYTAVSACNALTFGFGVALAIAVELTAIPLRGGLTIRPGLAGGTLVVATMLGRRSGYALWDALHEPATLQVMAFGAWSTLAGSTIKLVMRRDLGRAPAAV